MAHFTQTSESDYVYNKLPSDQTCHVSKEMLEDFNRNGYVIVRNIFSHAEIDKVNFAIQSGERWNEAAFALRDTEKYSYKQTHWIVPGDDIFGMCCRTEKVLNVCEELLQRGEIYMYSGKVIMKQPKDGGALLWHQDYGYWYNNRALFPDFVTALIALTKSDRENGGLQVIKGSHLCGRIEHGPQAGQQGADTKRVQMILEVLPKVHCDLKPGDTVYFHANTLHGSEINLSEHERNHLIYSYCTKNNSPDTPHYNAIYTEPLEKMKTDVVEKCENPAINPNRKYLDPKENKNINTEG